ncbi:MAG: hypothetical protein A2Y91_04355 [Chloroflexi bacterium RBG_13_54_8]|nr:MAG: hypothetical protein A2Y91_04355 [Chloroflexi bacterium RBG_13_54_8]
MGVRLHGEPDLEKPVLLAVWPGIGNIGLIAVDILRRALMAEEFGEIEPWDFFYPKKIAIRNGELKSLEFPSNKFYFKKTEKRDLIFFLGEEQPADIGRAYAEGKKAYEMAKLVLDVAQGFGCARVYTSGAAVARVHHTMRPRVWAVPNMESLIDEVRGYDNAVLMSGVEERAGQGHITGLNGLLLGVARKRGLEAICVMGEIPVYLQGLAIPYPKASKSVLEVLTATLGVKIAMEETEAIVERSEGEIEELYGRFPVEIREHLDRLKQLVHTRPTDSGPITEEDKRRILEEVDRFFRKGTEGDQV